MEEHVEIKGSHNWVGGGWYRNACENADIKLCRHQHFGNSIFHNMCNSY